LSFLRDNTSFALNLCDILDSIVNEYPELNFDENNINLTVVTKKTRKSKGIREGIKKEQDYDSDTK